MINPGVIGVSERLIDSEPYVSGAPHIVKADIEKVGTQPELENDANLVELVALLVSCSLLHAPEE